MSSKPFDPDEFKRITDALRPDPEQFKRITDALQPDPEQFKRIAEALAPDPEQFKRIADALAPDPEQFKRIADALAPDPEQFKRITDALQPDPEEFKRITDALQPDPEEFRRITEALQLQVGQTLAMSGLAIAGVPQPTAAAISDFAQVLDSEAADVELSLWLRGLAPLARPTVFVRAVAALIAIIEYIQVEVGLQPSVSVIYLVAALMAIAFFLASLENPP